MSHHELIELHERHVSFGAVARYASKPDVHRLITSATAARSQVIERASAIRYWTGAIKAKVRTTFRPIYFV